MLMTAGDISSYLAFQCRRSARLCAPRHRATLRLSVLRYRQYGLLDFVVCRKRHLDILATPDRPRRRSSSGTRPSSRVTEAQQVRDAGYSLRRARHFPGKLPLEGRVYHTPEVHDSVDGLNVYGVGRFQGRIFRIQSPHLGGDVRITGAASKSARAECRTTRQATEHQDRY